MKYEITKEQILETIRTGTDVTERYFKEIIPEAFKKELEIGKWYITDGNKCGQYGKTLIANFSGKEESSNYGITFSGTWGKDLTLYHNDLGRSTRLATPEEVSAALINEAKKRGYKEGVTITWKNKPKLIYTLGDGEFDYLRSKNVLVFGNYGVFDGKQWAQILPQEKTVVPIAKALKIIAKKMKVSPENIEISFENRNKRI